MSERADLLISITTLSATEFSAALSYNRPGSSTLIAPRRGAFKLDQETRQKLLLSTLDPAPHGRVLRDMLFSDPELRSYFEQSMASAAGGLRLRLEIDENATALQNLRWETVYDLEDHDFLARQAERPFSRFLYSQDWSDYELRPKGNLRALVVVANPTDLQQAGDISGAAVAQVDVGGEIERAQAALHAISITILESRGEEPGRVTVAALQTALRQGTDILYLVCHGKLVRDKEIPGKETPFLLLEQPDGSSGWTDATILVDYIRSLPAARRPRLVVLASCQSSGRSRITETASIQESNSTDHGALAAIGPQLVIRAGVPAVVAMQENVTMQTVRQFMPVFFEELLKAGQVDEAMAIARSAIMARRDWWVPVLYLRLSAGRLWHDSATVAALPRHFRHLMEQFSNEYLGTPENPQPFGGRKAQFEQFNTWLMDPGAPGYALLAAEAGRGKSALLVYWTRHVEQLGLSEVIFVPISMRLETGSPNEYLALLAGQLARFHNEPPPPASASTEAWAAICQEYLQRALPPGRNLVVVLDGLDESASLDYLPYFFPASLPTGCRLIVTIQLTSSVDVQAWLERLNWQAERARVFSLPLLDLNGLKEGLRTMGDPLRKLSAPGFDPAVTLFQLTSGDPLLVGLYLDDLSQHGKEATWLQPDFLELQPRGLEGFFELNWWPAKKKQWQTENRDADLLEQQTIDFLSVCAGALGPVSRNDILEILPDRFPSSVHIKRAAHDVARLVQGDGKKNGYAFTHARLSDYFWSELTAAERRAYQARFIAYGRRVLESLVSGDLSPQRAAEEHAYILQHHAQHLQQAGVSENDYYALLCLPWLQARQALEGIPEGFLSDAATAWKHSERAHSVRTGIQVRAALCFSSVASLSANLPAPLLATCLKKGVIKSPAIGLALARRAPDPAVRSAALAAVSVDLPEDLQDGAIEDAFYACLQVDNDIERGRLIAELAPRLNPTLFAQAFQAVTQNMQHADARAQTLLALAASLPPEQPNPIVGQAMHAIQNVIDMSHRSTLLVKLLPLLSVEDQHKILAELLTSVAQTTDPGHISQVIRNLAQSLPIDLLDSAVKIAEEITAGVERTNALLALLPCLQGDLRLAITSLALGSAIQLENEFERADTLSRLAPYLTADQYMLALDAARQIKKDVHRSRAIAHLAPFSPTDSRKQVLEEGLQAARESSDGFARVYALATLAPQLPAEHSSAVMLEALQVTNLIRSEDFRVRALNAIAPRLSPELIEMALQTCREIDAENTRARGLVVLAPLLPLKLLPQALEIARLISDEDARANALAVLAPVLPANLLAQALESAQMIADHAVRAHTLLIFSSGLPDASRQELALEALATAQKIILAQDRARALASIAEILPGELRIQALTLALQSVAQVSKQLVRANILKSLAPSLPAEMLAAALEITAQMSQEHDRANALAALIPYFDAGLIEKAYNLALQIQDEYDRAEVMSSLAPRLSAHLVPGALQACQQISNLSAQGLALAAFAIILPGKQGRELMEQSFDAAMQGKNLAARARILALLAPTLTRKLRAQSLEAASQITNEIERAGLLSTMSAHLTNVELTQAFQIAQQLNSDAAKCRWIVGLASSLPVEFLALAIKLAGEIKSKDEHIQALASLAPRLPEELLLQVWQSSGEHTNAELRAASMTILVKYLPVNKFPTAIVQTVEAVRQSILPDERARLLTELALHLPPDFRQDILLQACMAAQQIQDNRYNRARAIARLTAHLPSSKLNDLLIELENLSAEFPSLEILRGLVDRWLETCDAANLTELEMFNKILHLFSRHSRSQMCGALQTLAPVVSRLGGHTAIQESCKAILETAIWWP